MARKAASTAAWDLYERAANAGRSKAALADLHALADADDIEAISVLSIIYNNGIRARNGRQIVRRDPAAARRYDERGAKLGDPGSMTSLANTLADRPATRSRAIRLYRAAFAKGHETAAFNLAMTYRNLGNHRAAVAWLRKAEHNGDLSATFELALAELHGLGIKRNAASAFVRLRRVARSKQEVVPPFWQQAQAMLVMAHALLQGWLVSIDADAGWTWERRAAELGSEVARARLGT